MKIYCLYGYGKETERSYWYMQGEYEQDESRSDAIDESGFVSQARGGGGRFLLMLVRCQRPL
jgi:phospholipid:diacylglycerol acyltransferase